jgi:hypothetical protein
MRTVAERHADNIAVYAKQSWHYLWHTIIPRFLRRLNQSRIGGTPHATSHPAVVVPCRRELVTLEWQSR